MDQVSNSSNFKGFLAQIVASHHFEGSMVTANGTSTSCLTVACCSKHYLGFAVI
jgi:hypothetical protein